MTETTTSILETIAAALGIADPDITEYMHLCQLLNVDQFTIVTLDESNREQLQIDHDRGQRRFVRTFRPRKDGTYNVKRIVSVVKEATQ